MFDKMALAMTMFVYSAIPGGTTTITPGAHMSGTTYHLLTEAEPFSEFEGGAISRWAANVLRHNAYSVVVCPSADNTWKFAPEAIHRMPRLKIYRCLRRYLFRLPWALHRRAIRWIFTPLLRRLQPGDIVWIHNRPEFAVALTPLIQRTAGRVVLHLHNAHLAEGPERLMRRVGVDKLIFASKFLLEQAQRRFPLLGASSVLYSGADQSVFYPPLTEREKADQPTVLFAGRLVEEKGVHVLLNAMKLLEKQKVPLQAYIVGCSSFGVGKETAYIKRLKAASPATVAFLPYRTGAALGDLFRRADMFCSPAIWDEPFGLVNVEALASGLPVVSTRSGGTSEIFSSGGGILVERGSAVDLASALRRLAEDPGLRTHLGRQGYAAFLERFTWSHTCVQVQDIERTLGN
jgi:spore coat protein SA